VTTRNEGVYEYYGMISSSAGRLHHAGFICQLHEFIICRIHLNRAEGIDIKGSKTIMPPCLTNAFQSL
jgi:hypothetical protein